MHVRTEVAGVHESTSSLPPLHSMLEHVQKAAPGVRQQWPPEGFVHVCVAVAPTPDGLLSHVQPKLSLKQTVGSLTHLHSVVAPPLTVAQQ